MKKFFSAILLMTMMVFSVGTFVSCNDLVEEVEDIKNQTNVNAGAISDLESALTALQAKLASDYATKQELDAAKTALQGALDTEVADLEGQIAKINDAIAAINDAQKADADALANLSKLVDEAIATINATTKELADAQAALKANTEANAGAIADLAARMTAAETAIKDIQAAAETFKTDIEALKTATMQNTEVITNLSVAYTNFQEVTEERLDKAEANIEALEAYVDQMVAEIYGRIETVEEALSAVANLVADLETEDTAIYKEIEKLQESVSAVNNLINDLDAEDVKIYKEIEGALAAVSAVNALIEDLKNEDTQLYQQFNTLQETLSTVIMAVADLETVVAEIEDRLAAQEAALAALKDADAKAKEELDALKAAKDALDEKVADLEEKVLAFADAETVNAALDALKADAEAAKTALDEINNKLNNLSGMVDAIVNQIQDVTYVPTTAIRLIPSFQYYYGEDGYNKEKVETDVMIIATYEVRPAAAVVALTDENIRFSTVETKAAPAEYFDAKIIDRDEETGRMIVVGYIDEDSEAIGRLTKTAFALDVAVKRQFADEDGNPVLPEVGSYVTSEYVNADATSTDDVLGRIKIEYVGTNGRVAYGTSYTNQYKVPYTTVGEASATALFEDFKGLVVDVAGNTLPLDVAAEVLGFEEFEVAYGAFEATYYNPATGDHKYPAGKVKPIEVTGEKFEAVATHVGSNDYKEKNAIDHKATVTVKSVTINGLPVGLTLAPSYVIGKPESDITLSDTKFSWKYSYGAELDGTEFNTIAAADLELDVLSGSDNVNALLASATTFTAKDAYNNVLGTLNVKAKSKKAVEITGGSVKFPKGQAATYKFVGTATSADQVEYELSFNVDVAAMPKDKVIELDDVNIEQRFKSTMTAKVNPVAEILAADAAYYPEFSGSKNTRNALLDAFAVADNGISRVNILTIYDKNGTSMNTVTGTAPAITSTPPADFNVNVDWNTADAAFGETSMIYMPNDKKIGDKFTYEYVYNVFGVKYTIVVNATVTKATFSLDTNDLLVAANNIVNLDNGKVVVPEIDSKGNPSTRVAYELPTIDLRDYVEVVGETNADKTNKELILLYTVLDERTVSVGGVPTPVNQPADLATITNNLNSGKAFTYTDHNNPLDNEVILKWNVDPSTYVHATNAGIDCNTIKVKIELIAAHTYSSTNPVRDNFLIYDAETITLKVPELVELGTIEPAYNATRPSSNKGAYSTFDVATQTWTSVNVVKGLTATDVKSGKALYNKYAEDLTEFWHDYTKTGNTWSTGSVTNFFAIYGQEIVKVKEDQYGNKDVSAVTKSGKTVDPIYYNVDADGTVTLTPQSAIYNEDIYVSVTVVLNHDYCPADTHEETVKVLFAK